MEWLNRFPVVSDRSDQHLIWNGSIIDFSFSVFFVFSFGERWEPERWEPKQEGEKRRKKLGRRRKGKAAAGGYLNIDFDQLRSGRRSQLSN